MLIDTHTHLDDARYNDDREAVITRAREAGVEAFVTIGCDLATSQSAVALAERYPFVYASIGVHPHEVKHIQDDWYDTFPSSGKDGEGRGIRGNRLDYHYNHSSPKEQRERFREQIQLARELRLPVIIHTREAQDETIAIVEGRGGVRDRWGLSLLFRRCLAGKRGPGSRVLSVVFRNPHISECDCLKRRRQEYPPRSRA